MKKTYKIVRKSSTNEWIVRQYVDGKLDSDSDYYTDSEQDALDTLKLLLSGYDESAAE